VPALFQNALGEKWQDLPPCVRRLHCGHAVESFSGLAQVRRGRGLLARLAAWLVGLPREGDDVPVTVTKTRTPACETWERNFAGRRMRSVLTPSARPQHCCERFGPFTFELALSVDDCALHFPVRRGWLLALPLPAALLPTSCAREFAVDGTFHFDVGLYAPLTRGLLVRYQGHLSPDRA
jgi:hypothetical protein